MHKPLVRAATPSASPWTSKGSIMNIKDVMKKDMKRLYISHRLRGLAVAMALVPAAAMIFSSCSDFLEIEPRNEIILEKFWTEKADVDGIVAGCYSSLQSEACIRRMIIWGEARSENISPGLNSDQDRDLLNLLNENIKATNSYTTWVDFYSIINRCNTVLKYAPGVASIDPGYTESELNATISEMVALRSLCYFYLIRTFRDVPYTTVAYTDDDQEMALPATPFDQVLDSIINDLESVKSLAVKRYPTTDPEYQTGRITQDAIHAMLCEMYLWKQDYDHCIEYADLVIESKKKLAEELLHSNTGSGRGRTGSTSDLNFERTNGYPLLNGMIGTNEFGNTFNYMFSSDDYIERASQEVIFQLIFNDNSAGRGMLANKAVSTLYGNETNARGHMAPSDIIAEDVEKTSGRYIFEDKNKKMDSRMYENCVYGNSESSIAKFVYKTMDITSTTPDKVPTLDYRGRWTADQTGANWIIYRLSDIMLLKAEALTQKLHEGSDQATIDYNTPILEQAFSLVNAVNKRSVCQTNLTDTLVASDYLTKQQMDNLVFRERQRELMFEGKRWYDLVRHARRDGNTSFLSQAALRKVTTGSSLIAVKLQKMDAIYWPINNEEMKVNPNLRQNPAFASGENESYK